MQEKLPVLPEQTAGYAEERKHWLEYAIFVFVVLTTIATFTAAWYTRKQWITADEVQQRQLRAYLGITSIDYDKKNEGYLTVVVSNGGLTPAHNVVVDSTVGVMEGVVDIPKELALATRIATNSTTNGTIILPQKAVSFYVIFDFSKLDEVAEKKITLLFYGYVDYVDVYGSKHSCSFAMRAAADREIKSEVGLFYLKDRNNDCD
jgi:hypothetical protein